MITRHISSIIVIIVVNVCFIQSLMADLEAQEAQFNSVQDKGELLTLERHPASKTIEAFMAAMQTQWSWLVQLTGCMESHMKHTTQHQQVQNSANFSPDVSLRPDVI